MTIWLTAARHRSGVSKTTLVRPVRSRRRAVALTQDASAELFVAASKAVATPVVVPATKRKRPDSYWHWRQIKARRQRKQAQGSV